MKSITGGYNLRYYPKLLTSPIVLYLEKYAVNTPFTVGNGKKIYWEVYYGIRIMERARELVSWNRGKACMSGKGTCNE